MKQTAIRLFIRSESMRVDGHEKCDSNLNLELVMTMSDRSVTTHMGLSIDFMPMKKNFELIRQ